MEIYTPKTKIKLSPVIRNGREFVEVTFGNDNDIRLSLSKEENVLLVGGRAYLPAEDFVLAEFLRPLCENGVYRLFCHQGNRPP